jgi:2-hydroxychromene-2-carboxylate isomerase
MIIPAIGFHFEWTPQSNTDVASLRNADWLVMVPVGKAPMPTLDFFLEFASTYSYPAAMRIGALANTTGVTVRWRPFLLGPIFKAQGWDNSPFNIYPDKGRYMWRDLERLTAAAGLPFRRPDPFPQSSLLAARVAHVGLGEHWGEAFCLAVYEAEFGQGRSIADERVIAGLLTELGLEPQPVLARAQSDEIKAKLRAETETAQRLGIFGAPSFVIGSELFWGNDRLEQALAWAAAAGS